jgi:2-methylfumaryl-CoA isomerase
MMADPDGTDIAQVRHEAPVRLSRPVAGELARSTTYQGRPLEGLRVLEGSAFVAAPLGGMTLAQLGADVIRFDAIGGGIDFHRWPCTSDGRSLFWASMNKGKRSLAVDLRSERGQELVTQLVTAPGSDRGIFLSNFPESGWLADAALRRIRKDLIYVNVLGNPDGSTAVDYTVNPSSGFAYATGPAGAALPTNHVLPAWDMATGLHAAIGVLAAERVRSRTGLGQLITVSLSDVAFAMVSNLGYLAQVQVLEEDRPPIGNDMYGAFGRDFPTADNRRVMVVAISLRQWQALASATAIEQHLPAVERAFNVDLAQEGDRFVARDALAALIGSWIGSHSLAEVASTFDAHGVCWGPYQTFRQLLEDDWRCSLKNPLFSDIDQPGIGTIRVAGTPIGFSAIEREEPARAPLLGEHTDMILAEDLGLSSAEIGRLHDDGVVAASASAPVPVR